MDYSKSEEIMDSKKTDQRVRLTRSLLKTSLVQLMHSQHISKISVRALCEQAGINRSTFYTHYTDPYDLLGQMEREALEDIKAALDPGQPNKRELVSTPALTRILEHIQKNAELYKVLLSENCDFAFQRDIMELAQLISSQWADTYGERKQAYFREFGTRGCISIFQKWLHDDMPESPAEMAEFVLRLLYRGMDSFTGETEQ